jgi:hypothetical protein
LIRRIVLSTSLLGAALCAMLLALSFLRPAVIEAWGRDAVAAEARQRVQQHLSNVADSLAVTQAARAAAAHRVALIRMGQTSETLERLGRAKYQQIAQALMREFRIFCVANASVFLALAMIAFWWRRSPRLLIAPTVVMLGAAAIVGCTYLLSQDWLKTILVGDYVGLWYFPYLGIALVTMCDMVFNKARLTGTTIQLAVNTVGAFFSAPG